MASRFMWESVLTDSERAFLQANGGCTMCRRFWTDHWSRDCPFGFPDGLTYHTLSAANVPPRPKNYVLVFQKSQRPVSNEMSKPAASARQATVMTQNSRASRAVTAIIEEVDDADNVVAVIPSYMLNEQRQDEDSVSLAPIGWSVVVMYLFVGRSMQTAG